MISAPFNHRWWLCVAFVLLESCFPAYSKGVLRSDMPGNRRSKLLQSASFESSDLSHYVDAISKMVNFFWLERARTNVDALYGLRIAQGQFLYISGSSGSLKGSHPSLLHKLEIISRKLNRTLVAGLQAMHVRNDAYDRTLGWVVESVWVAEPLVYTLSMQDAVPLAKREAFRFSERKSDQCMAEVIGTSPSGQACTFSPNCWRLMHDHLMRSLGYALTHNSLYFFLARHRGCEKAVNKKLLASVKNGHLRSMKDVLAQSCANIYVEMADAAAHLPIPIGSDQDLFLEQGALCSAYGYPEVLQKHWVDLAVSWMGESGCIVTDPRQRRSARWRSRHLLMDVDLGNGCSEHTTTLALAYVTAYVRYELEKAVKADQQSPTGGKRGHDSGTGGQSQGRASHWQSLMKQEAEHIQALQGMLKKLKSLLSQ